MLPGVDQNFAASGLGAEGAADGGSLDELRSCSHYRYDLHSEHSLERDPEQDRPRIALPIHRQMRTSM